MTIKAGHSRGQLGFGPAGGLTIGRKPGILTNSESGRRITARGPSLSNHPILFHRSGATTDWLCPRRRFWNYEFLGRGIVAPETQLELYFGTLIHDGIDALVHSVSIDDIVDKGVKQLRAKLLEGRELDSDAQFFAEEQCALAEGLLRGFHKARWGQICNDYPDVVMAEKELTYDYEVDGQKLQFLSKPDLVRRDREGNLWVFEWKTTSSNKEEWCVSPETKLLTSDLRWVQAGAVSVGDALVGVEEFPSKTGKRQARKWQSGKVVRANRVQKPCYRVRLDDGTEVTCSKDHQWLVPKDQSFRTAGGTLNASWVRTDAIAPGTKLLKVVEPWDEAAYNAYDRGYLGAAFDGEGTLLQGKKAQPVVTFSQSDNEMLSKVKAALERCGIEFTGPYPQRRKKPNPRHRQNYWIRVCGKSNVMKLLGLTRADRLLAKFDVNQFNGAFPIKTVRVVACDYLGWQEVVSLETTSHTFIAAGIVSHNCHQWETAIQVHAQIRTVEAHLGEPVAGCVVQGFYKSYVSQWNRLESIFCYGYHHPGNPPFERPRWAFEYKAGLKKFPIWQRDGGVKQWVMEMPPALLSSQFPCTPPIFVKEEMVQAFFRQQGRREVAIRRARDQFTETPDLRLLDDVFPQHFESCNAWHRECPYRRLCFGAEADPLSIGFQLRQSHHQMEQEQFNDG